MYEAFRFFHPDCHLTAAPGSELHRNFETREIYEDDSHLMRKLLVCTTCGSLYFYEFLEEIDWVSGNDPQWRTWIPVPDAAAAEHLNTLDSHALRQFQHIEQDFSAETEAPEMAHWSPAIPPAI